MSLKLSTGRIKQKEYDFDLRDMKIIFALRI